MGTKKILTIPLRLTLVILLMGVLCKILEWPWAQQIMLVSFTVIGVLYSFRFWKKPKKVFIDYTKLTLVAFWTLNGVFNIMDLPYTTFFQVMIGISFILWFILEGTAYFLDGDRNTKNNNNRLLWNFAMVIGTLAIIFGGFMKILNWEYAIPTLILGLIIVAGYVLKDVFTKDPGFKE